MFVEIVMFVKTLRTSTASMKTPELAVKGTRLLKRSLETMFEAVNELVSTTQLLETDEKVFVKTVPSIQTAAWGDGIGGAFVSSELSA